MNKLNVQYLWNWVTYHKVFFIFIVHLVYGIGLLVYGTVKGVYLQYIPWFVHQSQVTDPYTISFYASASQDFWFFFFVGVVVTIPFSLSPKEESIENKINFLFRDIGYNSPLMEFLKEKFNEHSCKLTDAKKEMTILDSDDNLIKLSIYSEMKILNMHHSTPIEGEFGLLRLYTDKSVIDNEKYPTWGTLIRCQFTGKNHQELIEVFKELSGDKLYERKYKIALEPGEIGTITITYELWIDKAEEFIIRPSFFAKQYSVKVCNRLKEKINFEYRDLNDDESVDSSNNKSELPANSEMKQVCCFNDLRADQDQIAIKFS